MFKSRASPGHGNLEGNGVVAAPVRFAVLGLERDGVW